MALLALTSLSMNNGAPKEGCWQGCVGVAGRAVWAWLGTPETLSSAGEIRCADLSPPVGKTSLLFFPPARMKRAAC